MIPLDVFLLNLTKYRGLFKASWTVSYFELPFKQEVQTFLQEKVPKKQGSS